MESSNLEIAQLVFTIITTICALYLTYIGLIHAAKPKIKIKLLSSPKVICSEEVLLIFECLNVGYWYAKPMAVNLTIYCNFDLQFKLIELLYGSTQSYKDLDAKVGVGNMQYLKAKGIKLSYGEEGEQFHVRAIMPEIAGKYRIRISAFSENGASFKKMYYLTTKAPPEPQKK